MSAVVIDHDARRVVYEHSLNFERDLPQYGTESGVLPDADPFIKHAPPLMWVEALDRLFAKMRTDGVNLGGLLAISGSGQQHGSIYLNASAAARFARLVSSGGLAENLAGVFARPTAPIWMDSSTTQECHEIRAALGGASASAELTGSDVFERFTGPQIRKFYREDADSYEQTTDVALVSSFLAGVLAGRIAPIDFGDGAGMNLMDFQRKVWSTAALHATASGLGDKLPLLVPSSYPTGIINSYFVAKYGVNPGALTFVWSGDNPCSTVGLGLVREGTAAVSLGTSDTFFGVMRRFRADARGEGHVFCSPTGDYMTLICFKNGSLAREKVREAHRLSWQGFDDALAATPPGNNGGMMLPWFEPEIVPRVNVRGVHRFDLDPANAAANCRAVVEGQMMSMRLHSGWMKVEPRQIFVTGGASKNDAILRVMADVMDCPVARVQVSNGAALGAALRAAHGYALKDTEEASWDEVLAGYSSTHGNITPDPEAARTYDRLIEKYAARERATLNNLSPLPRPSYVEA